MLSSSHPDLPVSIAFHPALCSPQAGAPLSPTGGHVPRLWQVVGSVSLATRVQFTSGQIVYSWPTLSGL